MNRTTQTRLKVPVILRRYFCIIRNTVQYKRRTRTAVIFIISAQGLFTRQCLSTASRASRPSTLLSAMAKNQMGAFWQPFRTATLIPLPLYVSWTMSLTRNALTMVAWQVVEIVPGVDANVPTKAIVQSSKVPGLFVAYKEVGWSSSSLTELRLTHVSG